MRVLLALLLSTTLVAGTSVRAQDARTTLVQNAARQWLAHVDKLDVPGSWNAAGARFKAAIPQERWAEGMRSTRGQWGALQQRASVSTRFDSKFEGAPPGEYAMVQYRSAYEKHS